MKRLWQQIALAAVGALVLSAVITALILALHQTDDKLIDKAIKTKNPALCEKVKHVTKLGTDAKRITITGEQAVAECKAYVEFGDRPYKL